MFLIEERRGTPTHVCTRQDVERVCKSRFVTEHILDFRRLMACAKTCAEAGDEAGEKKHKGLAGAQKSTLPGFVFSARQMVDHEWIDSKGKNHGVAAWRHQDWALVNGMIMCDFDHLENPVELFEQKLLPLKEKWGIKMVFITPSGFGLKCAFEAKAEIGDIAANQQAFAREAGLELDEVCIDASRLSFVPLWNDVLLLEDSLFTYENQTFIEKYTKQYFKGVASPDCFGGNVVSEGQAVPDHAPAAPTVDFSGYRYCGVEIPVIIDRLLGGKPIPEGKRHYTIFETAKKLRYVCERSKDKVAYFLFQLKWVQDLEREDHNVNKTIEDAMNKPYSSYMPKDLTAILKELCPEEFETQTEDETRPYVVFGERIQSLMDKFPCLRDVCWGMEVSTFAAALYVAAAFFGTLMTRCWYYFWYQPLKRRRLNYNVNIIGDPGSGKSFAHDLYDLICEPMIVADQVGNDALNKYKEEKQIWDNLSEKEKNKQPRPLQPPRNIIRCHGPRTANGVLIEDMYFAKEIVNGEEMHIHVLTFNPELDNMLAQSKGGQWIDKTSMEVLAFHNEIDNQQYKNNQSISGPFAVLWNMVFTGTQMALDKLVNERNFGSGLFSRLGCIPFLSDFFGESEYNKPTKAEMEKNERIKEWAYRLDKVCGELPLEPISRATNKWYNETNAAAKLEGDKVTAFLGRRTPYYGINVSAPFILMRHWEEWEKTRSFKCDKWDVELCNLVLDIQLHSQQLFFGKYAQMYFDNKARRKQESTTSNYDSKTKSLFRQLPETFGLEDVMKAGSYDKKPAQNIIALFKKRDWVKKINNKKGNELWQKKQTV